MTKFITLTGKKQVGKDTSAHMIARIIGSRKEDKSFLEEWANPSSRVHIVHFADALKEACVLIFGIDRQDMETEEGKRKMTSVLWPAANAAGYFAFGTQENTYNPCAGERMTVREVLQFVGTEMFRTQMDPDIWVKSVYRKQYGPDDIVVVADCRFPNEAEFAKSQGLLIKIERNNGLAEDSHASERALDSYTNYDAIIDNNADLIDLKEKLTTILRDHKLIA